MLTHLAVELLWIEAKIDNGAGIRSTTRGEDDMRAAVLTEVNKPLQISILFFASFPGTSLTRFARRNRIDNRSAMCDSE
jgi:hypothetical protein